MAQKIEKTPEAWKRIYREKRKVMEERGFPEVTPQEFYRDVFPAGSLQRKGHEEDPKGNIILTKIRGTGRRNWQYVITDELDGLKEAVGDPFGLIPPISFYGRTHTKRNAHELYAVAIDIDYVGIHQLKNLLKQFGNGVQLCPTYLVSSGKGLHLYYLLTEPIPLYRNLEPMLRDLKEAFIRRLWNDTSSLAPDKPDLTGLQAEYIANDKSQGIVPIASLKTDIDTFTYAGPVWVTVSYKDQSNGFTVWVDPGEKNNWEIKVPETTEAPTTAPETPAETTVPETTAAETPPETAAPYGTRSGIFRRRRTLRARGRRAS